jgi:Mg2+ and Co2+ transporter CorA
MAKTINTMDEARRQHLEFIQNVITRMNTNSFQIKGMTITIVSALLAIYASTTNVVFVFLSIAPTLLFWFLDSYYLQQERKFRGVYKQCL